MAIDLLNRFTTTQVNNTTNVQGTASATPESAEAARIIRSVYALKAGDSLQGELVSVKGTDISLLLGESVMLNAKLNKELAFTPGQLMTFTVNSNKHGKLSLSPLFANTGMEQNAMKALDAASIPVTDKTLAMAEELMKQGMPINKQTLSTVFREMGMYPDAEIMDLVMLHKMNIPVNSDNLSMMHLYQTNEQYLFSDLHGLSTQMTDLLADMVNSGQTDSVSAFIKGVVQLFADADPINNTNGSLNGNAEVVMNADGTKVLVPSSQEGQIQPDLQAENSVNSQRGTVLDMHSFESTESAVKGMDTAIAQNSLPQAPEEELLKWISKENIKTSDGTDQLNKNLFALLKEQMLMKPENMDSKEYVQKFYERLDEQMGKLQELIKAVGKEESALNRDVSTVKSNIQFMNQINELYHYVQLPIKMNDAHANGDLYVYKRKNSSTGVDGKLTALLHLSMPTLGNMDVFLSLEGEKLNTRFCLEKEEMLDFIEANIDRLNERLMKKGYQVQTTVTSDIKEDKTVIEHIMESELPIPILTSQSFDARC